MGAVQIGLEEQQRHGSPHVGQRRVVQDVEPVGAGLPIGIAGGQVDVLVVGRCGGPDESQTESHLEQEEPGQEDLHPL